MEISNSLSNRSQTFSNSLKRLNLTEDYSLFNSIWEFSLNNGGERELDFIRKDNSGDEINFNPRTARYPMILASDFGVKTFDLIIVAMLLSADDEIELPKEISAEITKKVAEIRHFLNNGELEDVELFRVCGMLILDRYRHLHLSNTDRQDMLSIYLKDLAEIILKNLPEKLAGAILLKRSLQRYESRN